MSDDRPPIRFENPPVVETLLGVQFRPLAGFTSAHFGWFWRSALGEEWGRPTEVPRLPDHRERFDDGPTWEVPGVTVRLTDRPAPGRMLFTDSGGGRRVQLQPGQFVMNWHLRKGADERYDYVHFDDRLTQLRQTWERFESFCDEAGLPRPVPDQWETTYINHIPPGELWSDPRDWPKVLPALFPIWEGFDGVRMEVMGGQRRLEIRPNAESPPVGRLYVNAELERSVRDGKRVDLLALTLTARGPVSKGPEDAPPGMESVADGLAAGHDAAVRGFAAVVSDRARRMWKQT